MYLFKYFHESDNPAVVNLANDYSGGVQEVHVGPETGDNEMWILKHFVVILIDNQRFAPSGWGSIANGLTNGITIPLLFNANFKTNGDMFAAADEVQSTADVFDSTSDYEYRFVFDFNHTGQPFFVSDADLDEYPQFFTAELHDDFSSMLSMFILVQGERIEYNDRNHSLLHAKYMSPHEFAFE